MFHYLFKHSRLILGLGIIFAAIALIVSLFFPRYYSAESQVLLISRGGGSVDPYTQAKAAERIGENLAQVVGTSDFYGKVMESAGIFDRTRWQDLSERARRKEWQKDAQAEVIYGSGLLQIIGYGRGKDDAAAFTEAITQTIATRGWEYVGGDVSIKIVNSPLASRMPARPNYVLNAVVGFVFGVLVGGWWVAQKKKSVFGI